ncbi:MAG: FtsX-like permease family protein [Gaiellaceae bacterium]
MVIGVLKRKAEIGLRRALGATKTDVRSESLAEAILLALAGATIGIALGASLTAVFAAAKGWALVIPPRSLLPRFPGHPRNWRGSRGLSRAACCSRLLPSDALRGS